MAAPSMTLARVYQFWYDSMGVLVMCDVYKVLDGKFVWVARMQVADAKAYCKRHIGCVSLAIIPF